LTAVRPPAFVAAPAAFSLATLAAVGLVAAVPPAVLVVLVLVAGAAFVAAAARVPRLDLTTVVPVETAEESDAEVCVEDWLAVR
jgi:hypothetical protein